MTPEELHEAQEVSHRYPDQLDTGCLWVFVAIAAVAFAALCGFAYVFLREVL